CLVIERDPIVKAKEVASVDRLSGGRFLFGVGAGWNAEEMANHGTDPSKRFGVMRERIEAMRAIWTEDEASSARRHVSCARLGSLEEGGAHRVAFWLPGHGRGEVEGACDSFAARAREYAGAAEAAEHDNRPSDPEACRDLSPMGRKSQHTLARLRPLSRNT